jgi:hypothetical protein
MVGGAVLELKAAAWLDARARMVDVAVAEYAAVEWEIGRNRGGVVYWNGAGDPNGYSLPGQVRS